MAMTAADVFANIRKPPQMMAAGSSRSTPVPVFSMLNPLTPDYDNDSSEESDSNERSPSALDSVLTPSGPNLMGHFSSTSEDEDPDETVLARVVESNIALRPACYAFHHGFKGKGRAGDNFNGPMYTRLCNAMDICDVPQIQPASAETARFRLTTNDPLHDLKRWILTENDRLLGGAEDRNSETFIHSLHLTEHDIRKALLEAVMHIHYEHESMQNLAAYGRDEPYYLDFPDELARHADRRYFPHHKLTVKKQVDKMYGGLSRLELLAEVRWAVVELDYLRGMSETIAADILDKIANLARRGHWWEQQTLLNSGYVDEEWIEAHC